MHIETIQLDSNNKNVTLTSYVIDDSTELLNGKKRPAILICPGGAYLNLADKEAEPVALRFAAMGYHAFVLKYNVYLDEMDPFEKLFGEIEVRERSLYPSSMIDIAKAMNVLHQKSNEWLIDTEKIILCGFSAGGHNVCNYAVHWDKPILTNLFDESLLKPAAIIACYPLTDYIYKKDEPVHDDFGRLLFKAGNIAFFGCEHPSDEELLEVSPARLIDDNTPPMFIWATAGDSLVSVSHSTRLATALADKGIPFELHIFEEGPHGLSLGTQASAKAWPETNSDVAQWSELANKWLLKRFALPLDEQSKWA